MVRLEALYGRICKSPIGLFEVGESSLLGTQLIYKTLEIVHMIRKSIENNL